MGTSFDLPEPDRFTTGTVGPPGQRVFFIQASEGGHVVTLRIEKPWHAYANPVGNDDLEGARTTVEVYADGKKLPAMIDYPKGTAEKDDKGTEYRVYADEVTIAGTVSAKDATELEVRVKVQACTGGENGRCLQGATLKVRVK